jgi:hypothetical protein
MQGFVGHEETAGIVTKRFSVMPQWPGILEINSMVPELYATWQAQRTGI